jgi:hypothetical protein
MYVIELLVAVDPLQIVSSYSTFSENYNIITFIIIYFKL